MIDFYKVFLREDARKLAGPGERALFLGAFGKHPGWDDHIEEDERVRDLGLRTESLVCAKVLLYVQGIGRNLDTGAWEKLEPAQRLDGFNHLFLWQANNQFILGRLWSSRDGKGRTRYPMVVAAHVLRATLEWALATVVPRLERLSEECVSASTAVEVAARLDRSRSELRAMLPAAADPAPSLELLTRFVQHPEFGSGHEGLLRVLYQMQRQSVVFARGRFNPHNDVAKLRPQDLRVPAAGRDAREVFSAWTRLAQTQVDGAAPVLFLWPVGEPWLDIVLGEPTPDQLFCLRARPAKLPRVSEIPFNLEAPFRAHAESVLETLAQGNSPKSGAPLVSRFLSSLFKSR